MRKMHSVVTSISQKSEVGHICIQNRTIVTRYNEEKKIVKIITYSNTASQIFSPHKALERNRLPLHLNTVQIYHMTV